MVVLNRVQGGTPSLISSKTLSEASKLDHPTQRSLSSRCLINFIRNGTWTGMLNMTVNVLKLSQGPKIQEKISSATAELKFNVCVSEYMRSCVQLFMYVCM